MDMYMYLDYRIVREVGRYRYVSDASAELSIHFLSQKASTSSALSVGLTCVMLSMSRAHSHLAGAESSRGGQGGPRNHGSKNLDGAAVEMDVIFVLFVV